MRPERGPRKAASLRAPLHLFGPRVMIACPTRPESFMRITLLFLMLTASVAYAQSDAKSSKSPPSGPPWLDSFEEARAKALKSGKPIFLYSTKTY